MAEMLDLADCKATVRDVQPIKERYVFGGFGVLF